MRFLYNFLTLPAYLFFLYYKRRNHLIQEDFDAWVNRHIKKSKSKHGAFVELMCRLPEYRTLLYYRMPFAVRHFLNVFLRRTDYKISVGELIGNNVTVGANCVVLQDVPDNCVCYGNPCVIKKKV